MSASDRYTNGQSVQALYVNAHALARQGYAVDQGCTVTVNTGTLDQPDTLSVASGTVFHGARPVDVAQQNVNIGGGDADPRKDAVYVDGAGDVQVVEGSPGEIPQEQAGATRFGTYRPSPPDFADRDQVLLAEVWVPANASSITADDLADRRVFETAQQVLADAQVTLSGGADPALDTTVAGVTDDQLRNADVVVVPDADPAFAADYAYTVDWARAWDDSDQQVDVDVTVTWDADPGAGNDVSATVYVITEDI